MTLTSQRGPLARSLTLVSAALAFTLGVSLVAVIPASPAQAAPPEHSITVTGGFTFAFDPADVDAGASLFNYGGESSTPTIPDRVTAEGVTYVVREIGDYSFSWGYMTEGQTLGAKLTSVHIPDSVTRIGHLAFVKNDLTGIDLPDSLIEIGVSAFSENLLNTPIEIPPGTNRIESNAFFDNSIPSVTFPDSLVSIGEDAFQWNQLSELDLPDSLTELGPSAFFGNHLTRVRLSNSLTSIPQSSFASNALSEITLPQSITELEYQAFADNNFSEFEIPDTVTKIGPLVFLENDLQRIVIPDTITTIPLMAFAMNELTELTIPTSVTTIEAGAFGSNQLTELTVPGSVTSLNGFDNNKLTSVEIADSVTDIGDNAFEHNLLTDIDIPDSVTKIGSYAFWGNELSEVVIPGSVVSLGKSVFGGDVGITHATFLGAAPSSFVAGVSGDNLSGSLGDSDGLTVSYGCPFDADIVGDGGYTPGTWQGYQTLTPPSAQVEFVMDGFPSIADQAVACAGNVIQPAEPEVEDGWEFTGWFTDVGLTEPYDFSSPVSGDLTLYGGQGKKTYEVTFRPGAYLVSELPANQTITHGEQVTEPATPTGEKGWVFDAWYSDQDRTMPYSFEDPVTGLLTLYLGWKRATYVLSFDSGAHHNGDPLLSRPITHGQTLVEPAPLAPEVGYEFTGWYVDAERTTLFEFTEQVTGDITLYAGWALKSYTVRFMGADGPTEVRLDHGSTLPVPDDPTRDGYEFIGWFTDELLSIEYDFSAPVTGDLTLHAGWEALPAPETPEPPRLATTGAGELGSASLLALLLLLGGALLVRPRRA